MEKKYNTTMKIKTLTASFFVLSLLLSIHINLLAQEITLSMERKWETPIGLQIPESVIYDDSSGIVFVSNIVGSPSVKDGKGFISKISVDGQIIEKEWITGLDAPKGMAIYGNKLFVTNIDEIVEIDIAKSTILKHYPITGASFLNDLAVDEKGILYFTDTQKSSVYYFSNGKATKWLEDKLFAGANGLFYKKGILYIGTSKGILKAIINSGEVMSYIGTNTGVDGLFVTNDNYFVFSDWTGNIYITKPGKKVILLANTTAAKENAADFCVIPSKKILLVPTFAKNSVVGYSVNFLK